MNRLTTKPQVFCSCPRERLPPRLLDYYSLSSTTHKELWITIQSDVRLILHLVRYLGEQIVAFGLRHPSQKKGIGIALREALLNAAYHGNLELTTAELRQAERECLLYGEPKIIAKRQRSLPYCDRRIHVYAKFTPQQAQFVIRDEGPGFDYVVCTPLVIDDGDAARPKGRGLQRMFSFMDDVRFNETGNQVTLSLRRSVRPRPTILRRVA